MRKHNRYRDWDWKKLQKQQPIAFEDSFNLNLESQSRWSLFNGTWQKRPRELDHRLSLKKEEMTLQMQWAVHFYTYTHVHKCIHVHKSDLYIVCLNTVYVFYIYTRVHECVRVHKFDLYVVCIIHVCEFNLFIVCLNTVYVHFIYTLMHMSAYLYVNWICVLYVLFRLLMVYTRS